MDTVTIHNLQIQDHVSEIQRRLRWTPPPPPGQRSVAVEEAQRATSRNGNRARAGEINIGPLCPARPTVTRTTMPGKGNSACPSSSALNIDLPNMCASITHTHTHTTARTRAHTHRHTECTSTAYTHTHKHCLHTHTPRAHTKCTSTACTHTHTHTCPNVTKSAPASHFTLGLDGGAETYKTGQTKQTTCDVYSRRQLFPCGKEVCMYLPCMRVPVCLISRTRHTVTVRFNS